MSFRATTYIHIKTKCPGTVNSWDVVCVPVNNNEIFKKESFSPNTVCLQRWDGERNYAPEIFAELLKDHPCVWNDVEGLEGGYFTVVSPNGLLVRFRKIGFGEIPIHAKKTKPEEVRIAREWMESIFEAADAMQEKARGVRE